MVIPPDGEAELDGFLFEFPLSRCPFTHPLGTVKAASKRNIKIIGRPALCPAAD